MLGKGSFGSAYLVERKSDGRQYVAKELKLHGMNASERDHANNEIEVLKNLDHKNITQYIDHFEDKGVLFIVMEFADGGDLYNKIKNRKGRRYNEEEILKYFVQIALALYHMHEKKILHRDLKSENVFLMADGTVKLGDFGISSVLRHTYELRRTVVGTPYYFSPELVQNRPYNNKSDIWALGIILYELTTLGHAFVGKSMSDLGSNILKGKFPPIPDNYSPELAALIDGMLQSDPRRRPHIQAIVSSRYIRDALERMAAAEEPQDPTEHVAAEEAPAHADEPHAAAERVAAPVQEAAPSKPRKEHKSRITSNMTEEEKDRERRRQRREARKQQQQQQEEEERRRLQQQRIEQQHEQEAHQRPAEQQRQEQFHQEQMQHHSEHHQNGMRYDPPNTSTSELQAHHSDPAVEAPPQITLEAPTPQANSTTPESTLPIQGNEHSAEHAGGSASVVERLARERAEREKRREERAQKREQDRLEREAKREAERKQRRRDAGLPEEGPPGPIGVDPEVTHSKLDAVAEKLKQEQEERARRRAEREKEREAREARRATRKLRKEGENGEEKPRRRLTRTADSKDAAADQKPTRRSRRGTGVSTETDGEGDENRRSRRAKSARIGEGGERLEKPTRPERKHRTARTEEQPVAVVDLEAKKELVKKYTSRSANVGSRAARPTRDIAVIENGAADIVATKYSSGSAGPPRRPALRTKMDSELKYRLGTRPAARS